MCQNSNEENKRKYKSMKKKANKAVSRAMRENTEEVLTRLQNYLNGMFRLVKGLKTDSNEVEGVYGQRQKKIYVFDVDAGFEGNHRSVGYGKQCSLVWSCVEERECSCLEKGITF